MFSMRPPINVTDSMNYITRIVSDEKLIECQLKLCNGKYTTTITLDSFLFGLKKYKKKPRLFPNGYQSFFYNVSHFYWTCFFYLKFSTFPSNEFVKVILVQTPEGKRIM